MIGKRVEQRQRQTLTVPWRDRWPDCAHLQVVVDDAAHPESMSRPSVRLIWVCRLGAGTEAERRTELHKLGADSSRLWIEPVGNSTNCERD